MGAEHIHTAANIRAGVERSLRRMKTDYLDLVQFHRSLTRSEFEEHGALEAALALKKAGKVRFIPQRNIRTTDFRSRSSATPCGCTADSV